MCGILCMISNKKTENVTENILNFEEALVETKNRLNRRGPNLQDQHHIEISTEYKLKFIGNVLWQQGSGPCKQPVLSECKCHILLFNGDIYTKRCSSDQSDTNWLMDEFIQCKTETEFLDLFRQKIYGPFSMIYFNDITKTLYFMRDSLGRQSLLLGKINNEIVLTSVASKYWNPNDFIELPAIGIFKINFYHDSNIKIELFPWQNMNNHVIYNEQLQMLEQFIGKSINVNEDRRIIFDNNDKEIFNPLWTFDNIDWLKEYQQKLTGQSLSNIQINEIFHQLLTEPDLLATCDEILNLLSNSVKDRCLATPKICKNCMAIDLVTCHHPKIGILYSGGVDCSILAILADRFIDSNCPIDLINVSFEKASRQPPPSQNSDLINYDTPDRISARQTLIELKLICPKRKWNLVEVNVTRKELNLIIQSELSHLVYPLSTVLDESLGAALWFAARSNGFLINEDNEYYESPCRVLLMGSGADELFGGYTRHRNAFRRPTNDQTNWESLANELNFDWVRLPGRNLARDDRVIGDLGRTVRAPFVEEYLSMFIRNLLAEQKCFHYLPEGVGDKLLLRLCAYKLGLRDAAWLRKRALQFGSRIADSKQNAKDRSMVL